MKFTNSLLNFLCLQIQLRFSGVIFFVRILNLRIAQNIKAQNLGIMVEECKVQAASSTEGVTSPNNQKNKFRSLLISYFNIKQDNSGQTNRYCCIFCL